jgi:hypothetical protein
MLLADVKTSRMDLRDFVEIAFSGLFDAAHAARI